MEKIYIGQSVDVEYRLCNHFSNSIIAAKQTGGSSSGIKNALHGRTKTSGGYRWEYE